MTDAPESTTPTPAPETTQAPAPTPAPSAPGPSPWALPLLLVVVVLVWFSSLGAAFVFDDLMFLNELSCWQIERWADLPGVVSTPGCRYRRLRFLSLAVDHLLWGREPFGYHLTNLLLHLATTIGVWFAVRRMTPAAWQGGLLSGAFVGTLWWALHPVHTDSVTYVGGRRDLLTTLFFVLAFLAWPLGAMSRVRAAARVLLSLACLVLALFAKEMAATLPMIVALAMLYRPSVLGEGGTLAERVLPLVRRWGPWLMLPLAAAAITAIQRGWLAPMTQVGVLHGGSLFTHILTAISAYARYLEWIFVPWRLYGDYSDFPFAMSLADPRVWVGLVCLLGAWGGAWITRNRNPLASFGLLWFAVTLLPVSQIIPHHERVAEHYLYLPLIGGAFVIASLWRPIEGRVAPLALAALVAIGGAYAVRIQVRVMDFDSPTAFNFAILDHVPRSFRARIALAAAEAREGNAEFAATVLQSVYTDFPAGSNERAVAAGDLGEIYASVGNLPEAERLLRECLATLPDSAQHAAVLGTVLTRTGRAAEALPLIDAALERFPGRVAFEVYRGLALLALNQPAEALTWLQGAADKAPDDVPATLATADTLVRVGRPAESIVYYERAAALLPLDPMPWVRAAQAADAAGDPATALRAIEQALVRAPNDAALRAERDRRRQ